MISFTYVLVCCLAYAAAAEEKPAEGLVPPPPAEESASRELTDAGYVIRYGDGAYNRYPLRIVPLVREYQQKNPTETNEIEIGDDDKRRPLFYFTTYESVDVPEKRNLPTSRPYIEIRKKREAPVPEATTEVQKVNLRKKRTYCRKCGGGGGYGGYYVPVSYAVYPVYYGGGGNGCNTCGGGHGGGGGGGSFSYSSSSAQSSSGSFGWGKK